MSKLRTMSKLSKYVNDSQKICCIGLQTRILLDNNMKCNSPVVHRPLCWSAFNRTFQKHIIESKNQHESLQVEKQGENHSTSNICMVTNIVEKKMLQIEWGNGNEPLMYPYVWLRDHCQCDRCFHPVSHSRTMLFDELNVDVSPVDFQFNNSSVSITWSDGHSSSFSSHWLFERGFRDQFTKLKRPFTYRLPQIYWDANIIKDLPTANFNDLLTNDRSLLNWLQHLEVYGLVLIEDAPKTTGQIRKLVERFTFIKKTHYGEEFAVKAKADPSNVAYSSGPLQLHTDLPYYEYKPGLQLIHCIVQYEGQGAESHIADSYHVATELKKEKPELFKVLSETQVDWCDVGMDEGREFFKVLRRPVICINSEGEIYRTNFSHPQRDSFFNVDVQTVFKWYEAMKTFHNMLKDKKNCLQFKMKHGTMLSFDNHRIVHGRSSYDAQQGYREIEGCYMDWDEVRSKRRVLERKYS